MTRRRGRRSAKAEQRRTARLLVNRNALYDPIIVETSNTLTTDKIMFLVTQAVGDCSLEAATRYSPGEILSDNQGMGSNQIGEILKAKEDLNLRGWNR